MLNIPILYILGAAVRVFASDGATEGHAATYNDAPASYDDASAPSSPVLTLTNENFEQALAEHSRLFVKFYTPWCSYCQALAPEFEQAALQLADEPVVLAEVDCTVDEDLCAENDVQSFPTLFLFNQGIPTLYDGAREQLAMVKFIYRQLLPVVSDLTHVEPLTLSSFVLGDDVAVIGQGSKAHYQRFYDVAKQLRDEYRFGWQETDKDALTMTLYRQEDDYEVTFQVPDDDASTATTTVDAAATATSTATSTAATVLETSTGDATEEKAAEDGDEHRDDDVLDEAADDEKKDLATQWIYKHAMPLFGPIAANNYMDYDLAGLPLAYVFVENSEQLADLDKEVRALARKMRGEMYFVYLDTTQYPEQAEYLGMRTDDSSNSTALWPAFMIQAPPLNRYVLDQSKELTMTALRNHVEQFQRGEAELFLLSAPVPAEPYDGNVRVVVATQFHELVTQSATPVLLEVYAPWCGFCKALAPVYSHLAEHVQERKLPLVVAKMDGTANDIPEDLPYDLPVDGYPTIFYISKDANGTPYADTFSGDRSFSDLIQFIEKQPGMPTLDLTEEERAWAPVDTDVEEEEEHIPGEDGVWPDEYEDVEDDEEEDTPVQAGDKSEEEEEQAAAATRTPPSQPAPHDEL
ncbi:thioredoxin-like protein [Gongronella butleri]|nr:thioredoxin-like protein [Gongronella butleri]